MPPLVPPQCPQCPQCHEPGRSVRRDTVRAMLTEAASARLEAAGDLYFCRQATCDVVYYADAAPLFRRDDVRVVVFQKSDASERLVCYCFGHSVGALQDEVRRTGASEVSMEIAAACRAGRARCDVMNPQGTCCLGNVRRVVEGAMATRDAGPPPDAPANSCAGGCPDCHPSPESATDGRPPTDRGGRAGRWSVGGALAVAALSSACCWLPLVVFAVGGSAAGVATAAGLFAAYRGWLLGATAFLLGTGFYFAYGRKPRCAPGDACEVPNAGLRRLNRRLLWGATALVVIFAAFPEVLGLRSGETDASSRSAAGAHRTFRIEGMTCEGCTTHVREVITGLAGVMAAEVSYREGTARVTFAPDARVDERTVSEAVVSIGYRARPLAGEAP